MLYSVISKGILNMAFFAVGFYVINENDICFVSSGFKLLIIILELVNPIYTPYII